MRYEVNWDLSSSRR